MADRRVPQRAGAERPKPIRVRDLRPGDNGAGLPMLLCTRCEATFSADAGDYWAARPDAILRHCRRPMVRVIKQTRFVAA